MCLGVQQCHKTKHKTQQDAYQFKTIFKQLEIVNYQFCIANQSPTEHVCFCDKFIQKCWQTNFSNTISIKVFTVQVFLHSR